MPMYPVIAPSLLQEMAKLVTDYMEAEGLKINYGFIPSAVEKTGDQIVVHKESGDGLLSRTEVFDTVLLATGEQFYNKF